MSVTERFKFPLQRAITELERLECPLQGGLSVHYTEVDHPLSVQYRGFSPVQRV